MEISLDEQVANISLMKKEVAEKSIPIPMSFQCMLIATPWPSQVRNRMNNLSILLKILTSNDLGKSKYTAYLIKYLIIFLEMGLYQPTISSM